MWTFYFTFIHASLITGLLAQLVASISINSTLLVVASDDDSLSTASSSLRGYGIPYVLAKIASSADLFPQLNSSASLGNYGGIILHGNSLSDEQLEQIYAYQTYFGVRMVRYDVDPDTVFGTRPSSSGCCNTGVEQLISITNTSSFEGAGYKRGAGISSKELWHMPATISDSSIATEIAQFAAAGSFQNPTTAALVNKIGNREQMVWFMPFEAEWSSTSAILMHTWVHYLTRGLFYGFRRVYLGTQVDDVHLATGLYSPSGTRFRLRAQDLEMHKSWQAAINSKMNAGSNFFIELAHNGNGNVANGTSINSRTCSPGPISYTPNPETDAEFQKPIGTGTSVWPLTPAAFSWTNQCLALDTMEQWFATPENLNTFAHLSHTFTHLSLNNATYSDVSKEITFNQAWLASSGIASATRFSPKGLVPPAITGLHNGDAIQAWLDNGITSAVGDNTRSPLLNPSNEHWPLLTTLASKGLSNFPIIARWATNIYYNCDLPACIETQYLAGIGTPLPFSSILDIERSTNTRHLFALRHDPFMFHQANMRVADVPAATVDGVAGQFSLLQTWIETLVAEFTRLVDWPILSLTHDSLASAFLARRQRDMCRPSMMYNLDSAGLAIESVTLSAIDLACGSAIPLTFPGDVVDRGDTIAEQIGSDPLTLWATLNGEAKTFVLQKPVDVVRDV